MINFLKSNFGREEHESSTDVDKLHEEAAKRNAKFREAWDEELPQDKIEKIFAEKIRPLIRKHQLLPAYTGCLFWNGYQYGLPLDQIKQEVLSQAQLPAYLAALPTDFDFETAFQAMDQDLLASGVVEAGYHPFWDVDIEQAEIIDKNSLRQEEGRRFSSPNYYIPMEYIFISRSAEDKQPDNNI